MKDLSAFEEPERVKNSMCSIVPIVVQKIFHRRDAEGTEKRLSVVKIKIYSANDIALRYHQFYNQSLARAIPLN